MDKQISTACKVNEVIVNKGSNQRPAIINFEEGVLLQERANKFKCKLIKDDDDDENNKMETENHRRETMVLKSDDPEEKFLGKIIPPESTMCRTLLMIRNKDTNKLQLIEIDQYRVSKVIDNADSEDSDSDTTDNVYATKRDKLYKMFGSKRSLRTLDLSNKTRVNQEVMTKQMEKTASKITVDTQDLEVSSGSIEQYVPKCNREATRVEDVYRLEDMLTTEELESLDEVTEKVLSDPPTESSEGSEFSHFFVNALKYLGAKRTPTQIKCLLYADAILYFLKLGLKDIKRKKISNNICPFSKLVSEKIIEEFTIQTETGRIRPEQMTDKAVCWIVVLTLIACKFALDIALVSPHVLNRQLDIRRFEKILKALGLTSLNAGFWTLRVPLHSLAKQEVRLTQSRKRRSK